MAAGEIGAKYDQVAKLIWRNREILALPSDAETRRTRAQIRSNQFMPKETLFVP